jgi:signal transduction histidine kinase
VPFRAIDDPGKLRRILEAVLLLEKDLSLPLLLRHFVEEACSLVGARYGALGVLNEDRTGLAEFITVGIEDDAEDLIGLRPTGKGVLGLLIAEPSPLRLRDLKAHPDSYGFPANHPAMRSFLGVPVTSHDEVYGNLYLTDKIGGAEFTPDDEELVTALAIAAGIAIENARLNARVRELAVLDDRDRIARDLHDAVIQRLFAVGLSLQGISKSVTSPSVGERLNRAIADIDDTIRRIRSSIFELSSSSDVSGNRANILALVRELDPVVGFEVQVALDGPIDAAVPDDVLEHLLAGLREALTNIGRHAHATQARVSVAASSDLCTMRVSDNGHGIPTRPRGSTGLGLNNLRRRAEKLNGELLIESSEAGTTIEWRVPLAGS